MCERTERAMIRDADPKIEIETQAEQVTGQLDYGSRAEQIRSLQYAIVGDRLEESEFRAAGSIMFHRLWRLVLKYPVFCCGLGVWLVTMVVASLGLTVLFADEYWNFIPLGSGSRIAYWFDRPMKVFLFLGWLVGFCTVMIGVFREFGRRNS